MDIWLQKVFFFPKNGLIWLFYPYFRKRVTKLQAAL